MNETETLQPSEGKLTQVEIPINIGQAYGFVLPEANSWNEHLGIDNQTLFHDPITGIRIGISALYSAKEREGTKEGGDSLTVTVLDTEHYILVIMRVGDGITLKRPDWWLEAVSAHQEVFDKTGDSYPYPIDFRYSDVAAAQLIKNFASSQEQTGRTLERMHSFYLNELLNPTFLDSNEEGKVCFLQNILDKLFRQDFQSLCSYRDSLIFKLNGGIRHELPWLRNWINTISAHIFVVISKHQETNQLGNNFYLCGYTGFASQADITFNLEGPFPPDISYPIPTYPVPGSIPLAYADTNGPIDNLLSTIYPRLDEEGKEIVDRFIDNRAGATYGALTNPRFSNQATRKFFRSDESIVSYVTTDSCITPGVATDGFTYISRELGRGPINLQIYSKLMETLLFDGSEKTWIERQKLGELPDDLCASLLHITLDDKSA